MKWLKASMLVASIGVSANAYADSDVMFILDASNSIQQDGLQLTISKRGRKYIAKAVIPSIKDESGAPISVVCEELVSLKLPGKLAMTTGAWATTSGENIAYFDKIEVVQLP